MSVLPECLPYPLKYLSLSAILLRVTKKYPTFGQRIYFLFECLWEWQHTGRHNRDIVQPGFEKRFRWVCESIPVSPVVSVSHKFVSYIIFLAFCFPRWT
jgi:hypothetical protein